MKDAGEFATVWSEDEVDPEFLAAVEHRDAEWRRLVEEAKGERDKACDQRRAAIAAANAANAERDRLKGEVESLMEAGILHDRAFDRLKGELAAKNAVFERVMESWERDKGELAEADWLVRNAKACTLPDKHPEYERRLMAYVGAAAPAEQTRGEWAPTAEQIEAARKWMTEHNERVAALAKRVDALVRWASTPHPDPFREGDAK